MKVVETGEDLGFADTLIYYSLPLSVLTWVQSQDRILGNLEKRGVLIATLITRGTVDEDVHAVLRGNDRSEREFLRAVRERFLERTRREPRGTTAMRMSSGRT